MNAQSIFTLLSTQTPVITCDLPRTQRGIYGLIDHAGQLRYIGSTSAENENFRKRIHQRHRTGSEHVSHKFSAIYNCGRMWRDRNSQRHDADAKISKDLRSAFIAKYCRAVYVPFVGTKGEIEVLEYAVIALAPRENILWNGSKGLVYDEPVDLVDALIDELELATEDREALDRQCVRANSHRAGLHQS
ncbi:MAG: hypothetical protein AB7F96_12630 [Beijerinckiaceae bacterium]